MAESSTLKRAAVVTIAVGLVVVMGCACLVWKLGDLLQSEARDPVFHAQCDGGALTITYVRTENNFEGVATNRHYVGDLDGAEFGLDAFSDPTIYDWNPTPRRDHGEGDEAMHVFLGALDADAAAAVEVCVEDHADALLQALEDNPHNRHVARGWPGRRRVYWDGAPDDLVARFVDGDRTLSLERDGKITMSEPFGAGGITESWLGTVIDEAPRRVEWVDEPADLTPFRDADGRTLPERLGL